MAMGARRRQTHFEGVEQDVESGRDVNFTRARIGVQGIDDTQERSKGTVGDTSLGVKGGDIEDSGTGSLCFNDKGEIVKERRNGRDGEKRETST
jgi:hypothetical protein